MQALRSFSAAQELPDERQCNAEKRSKMNGFAREKQLSLYGFSEGSKTGKKSLAFKRN